MKNTNTIVKWVGGKRQLLKEIKERMPKTYDTYFEPFFGGGAVFFTIHPEKAVINDCNVQLMNLYKTIKNVPVTRFVSMMTEYQAEYNSLTTEEERAAYYYAKRNALNGFVKNGICSFDSACLFLFVNKVAFNGLYRENKQGLINSSFSKKKRVTLFEEENIFESAKALQNCKIMTGDYKNALSSVKAGDFVFFDSPYYETYTRYNKGGFSTEEHIRLAEIFRDLTERNVYCMLTNSNTDYMKDLYKEYNVDVVNVTRCVNSNSNDRRGTEIIVTNYKK